MSNKKQPIEVLQGEPMPFDLMVACEGLVNYVKVQETPLGVDFEASWNQMVHKIAKDLNYTVDTVKRAYSTIFSENVPLSNLYEGTISVKDPNHVYKKSHKPNTGFKLGSYKYKSR